MSGSKIETIDDLIELRDRIEKAIKTIESSKQSYRHEAKQQKIKVLETCRDYLDGEADKDELKRTIKDNQKYDNSVFKSRTKSLVQTTLNISDEIMEEREEKLKSGMTKDGYMRRTLS
jgi:phosphoenolpyruvate-protein kinase (PTS system EI component)